MSTEKEEQRRATRLAFGLTGLGLLVIAFLLWGAFMLLPVVAAGVEAVFSPGLGLKSAAIMAAGASVFIIIVFAIVAGDGLLGEFQFMIPGFFLFFLFFWLMTAWVF